MTIHIARVYDKVLPSGCRILVDRLWPRGLKKADLDLALWAKNIAPSHELRKAFHGGTKDWVAFKSAYQMELTHNDELQEWMNFCASEKEIVLLYASKNTAENHALLLRDLLIQSFGQK